MSRGSIWRKWDFHVHTKCTNKNDQFASQTMDDFFYNLYKKAINRDISAIGITDYFSVERYIDAINYRTAISSKVDKAGNPLFTNQEIDSINKIFLFPNVELRMLPSTNVGKLINIHCLFNPEYVPDLEHDFFSEIKNQDDIQMNRYGITNYGRSLESSLLDEGAQYKKGIDNFVIDITSLKNVLKKRKFSDNTLLVVSNSNKDGASAIQRHFDLFENEEGALDGLRKSIYHISHAVFSANPKDIKYFLGKRLEGTDGYNEEVYKAEVSKVKAERGSLKPCIVGCDAHTEADMFERFTWVKSDLTFEGLRQICLEPEQRVRIQKELPDYKEGKLIIDRVRFICPDGTFPESYVYLNQNLNVIVGGKSSGKSILLYTVAKTLCIDPTALKNDDDSDKYDLEKLAPGLDFEIVTKGGFRQMMKRGIEENSILPEIKYIPQNYLVKLAEPHLNKKGKSLNHLVRDLLLEEQSAKERYHEFVNYVAQNDKLRNGEIEKYFAIEREIFDLESELKMKSNKSVLEKNIHSNLEKIEALNESTGLSLEQMAAYKQLQLETDANNSRHQDFRDDFFVVKAFVSDFEQSARVLREKKNTLIDTLRLLEIKAYYQNLFSSIDDLLAIAEKSVVEIALQIEDDGKRHFMSECRFQEVQALMEAETIRLNAEMTPFIEDAQVKKAIAELNQSVAADKKALQDIDALANKVLDRRNKLSDCKKEIFKSYEDSFQQYLNIIGELKGRTVELQKDGLLIVGKTKFNFPKLRGLMYANSDGRTASYNNYAILTEHRTAIDDVDFPSMLSELKTLFDDIITRKYVLTSKLSIQNAAKLALNDYFFDYWEITYKGDKLGEMSTGKASFVILMLIIGLSNSKAPILIDQPEDNLDNRSITADLVYYLRNKKLERQIIIVTHNANIVVNADAENIIVANQKGQNDDNSTSLFKFDYINGAIENSFERIDSQTDILKSMGIRQHVAEIVEGGKDAFILREKKYRFT